MSIKELEGKIRYLELRVKYLEGRMKLLEGWKEDIKETIDWYTPMGGATLEGVKDEKDTSKVS